ncbi:MAG: alpha/beta hydrolase-fold protein [Planctomycetaceae bacterium]
MPSWPFYRTIRLSLPQSGSRLWSRPFVSCLVLTLLAQSATAESPATSTVAVHELKSPHQRTRTHLEILLPDNMQPRHRYPVLFVLPVEAGQTRRWGHALQEVQRHDLHSRFQIICVYPTFSDLPWYANHPGNPQLAQESYLLKTVVPFVDKHYPTTGTAQGRFLVGFSKSGWGAFSLLLRHPDSFAAAAAWDAPLMMDRHGQYGSGPIFGSLASFRNYELTRLIRTVDLKGQQPRLIHLGFSNFRQHHEEFEALLQGEKIPHIYRDGPQHKHAWDSGWLPAAVELLVKPPRS